MTELDLSTINPGVRKTVEWLRANRFETTDSGDGKTNAEAGMECSLPFPNVSIQVLSAELLVTECRRLKHLLKLRGINVQPIGMDAWIPSCEGTYDPANDIAIIMLTGVDDELLEGRHTERG